MTAPADGPQGSIDDDVQVLWWPEEAGVRDAMWVGTPCLLLVATDAEPPSELRDLEDWLRLPLDPTELGQRQDALRSRAAGGRALSVDDDGLVRRGKRWIALSPSELALFRPLFASIGRVVARADLLASARTQGVAMDARWLARPMRGLRERLRELGLEVHTVRGVGYLLDMT
jgi:DNA-binding response OmpR family regulator